MEDNTGKMQWSTRPLGFEKSKVTYRLQRLLDVEISGVLFPEAKNLTSFS